MHIYKVDSVTMKKASNRLIKLRNEAGLNQNQFAKAVGVSRACVSRWEKGDISTMVVRNGLRVCEVLGTCLLYTSDAAAE